MYEHTNTITLEDLYTVKTERTKRVKLAQLIKYIRNQK
jgi:hypothetical protein